MMEKLQILFPEPALSRLRRIASREDRPVSEIVRLAVDRFLQQKPDLPAQVRRSFPTFSGGGVKVPATRMKDILYEDDAL
jgi:hypothetical protein